MDGRKGTHASDRWWPLFRNQGNISAGIDWSGGRAASDPNLNADIYTRVGRKCGRYKEPSCHPLGRRLSGWRASFLSEEIGSVWVFFWRNLIFLLLVTHHPYHQRSLKYIRIQLTHEIARNLRNSLAWVNPENRCIESLRPSWICLGL